MLSGPYAYANPRVPRGIRETTGPGCHRLDCTGAVSMMPDNTPSPPAAAAPMKKTLVATALVLCLLAPARAQQTQKLTLALLVERGPQLLGPPPSVSWLPGGHDAALALCAAIVRRRP